MKKVIVFYILLTTVFACNNDRIKESSSDPDEVIDTVSVSEVSRNGLMKDSLAGFFIREGSKVKIKDALVNDAGFYVYFQLVNGKARNLKLYIQYEDYNIYQFSVDGEKYTYKTDKSKGRGEAKICWYDYDIKTVDMKLLRSLIKSKSARIIFSDGTSVAVSEEAKIGIERTLDYFELLGGQFPPYL